jgi:hypothetical protein
MSDPTTTTPAETMDLSWVWTPPRRMDPAEEEDGLFGTFDVITPEEWEAQRARLQPLSLGRMWLEYEELTDGIRNDEHYLGRPQDYVTAEDILEHIIDWDRGRQLRPLYEQLLVEKGWSGDGYPPMKAMCYCNVCRHRMGYWDRRDDVCDECEQEMWRDEAREEWRRWR